MTTAYRYLDKFVVGKIKSKHVLAKRERSF